MFGCLRIYVYILLSLAGKKDRKLMAYLKLKVSVAMSDAVLNRNYFSLLYTFIVYKLMNTGLSEHFQRNALDLVHGLQSNPNLLA